MGTEEKYRLLVGLDDMTPEERLDALAEVLAGGFFYLSENGMLQEGNETPTVDPLSDAKLLQEPSLTSVGKEGNPSSQDSDKRYENHGK